MFGTRISTAPPTSRLAPEVTYSGFSPCPSGMRAERQLPEPNRSQPQLFPRKRVERG
jgi:hypothetical protein